MERMEKTYCNPTPLPDYPIGRKIYYEDVASFRETADPTVIFEDGKWYLYSSCGMAYVSEDFITWKHERIEPYDMGYAPTVVKHNGKFYMTACFTDLRVADNPLGPFERLGDFTGIDGKTWSLPDPMLFADDDNRIYAYWGSGCDGIYGVELDPEKPNVFLAEPKNLFPYSAEHVWERNGDWNEDTAASTLEGAYMFKWNGIYYLTYAAPGTEYTSYAMGSYKGKSPLGDFKYMETNPFVSKKYGLVRGPGHGSLVEGPNQTIWAFYTCIICYAHEYERRIGYDPVGINENGDLFCNVSEIPQWAPGVVQKPEKGNDVGILPLTFHKFKTKASSMAPGRDAIYAVDDNMMSWWQPADDDNEPLLSVPLTVGGSKICAARIIWRDVGLDIKNNVMPGPFRYFIESTVDGDNWEVLVDKSKNNEDMTIDYLTFKEATAHIVRLRIVGAPDGIRPGVISFTVFGTAINF